MSEPFFHQIILPPANEPELEVLSTYQATRAFYTEVELREAFEEYCQWYQQVSEQHRRECEQMQGDLNILGWFLGSRR